MSDVFLAEDVELQRYVAIKLLRAEYNNNLYIRDLFVQEASLLLEFRHANAVAVFGYGKLADQRLYMVQELARGENLDILLDDRGRLDFSVACNIVEQILSCVQSAHEQGIIHRDLTPNNILVEEDLESKFPHIKVVDFGIAQSRKQGVEGGVIPLCIGTPAYMAPEIVMDETLFDHRVDIYSIGVLFYEMLYGQPPVYHDDLSTLFTYKVSKAWRYAPLWGEMPELLRHFFDSALAPSPRDRFFSAAAMLGELHEIKKMILKDDSISRTLAVPRW